MRELAAGVGFDKVDGDEEEGNEHGEGCGRERSRSPNSKFGWNLEVT